MPTQARLLGLFQGKGRLPQETVLANATAPGQAAEDREPINNVEALEEALEDIAWPATVSWLEAQVRERAPVAAA